MNDHDTDPGAPPIAAGDNDAGGPARPRRRRRPRGGGNPAADAATGDAGAAPVEGDAPVRESATAAQAGERGPRRNRRRGRRGAGDATPPAAPADTAPLYADMLAGAFDETAAEDTPASEPGQAPADAASAHTPQAADEAAGDTAQALDPVPGDEAGDAGEPGEADGPARRVLAPDPDAPKLHKVLAQAGIGSRRDMEDAIAAGRVTVNGQPAHTGQRIARGDRVALDGKPLKVRITPPPARVIAYHKPVGEVVTHDDPQQRPTVFRRLPRLTQGKWQSVGRLDINTEGLLLFTTSGELANQLMHPRFGVEREYAVRVLGTLEPDARTRLLDGVEIDGQPAAFKSIEDVGGEGANRWYKVVITEGRHREVRRLFDAVGLTVSRLIRVRYGVVVLPRGLKRGAWVDLDAADVKQLRRLTGAPPRAPGEPSSPVREGANEAGRGRRDGKRRRTGADRAERAQGGERIERIPNPLQQTYDKRALKEQQRQPRRDDGDDGPIPNPLQQTYDKRALKEQQRQPRRDYGDDGPIPNPLQQTYDKRALKEQQRQPRRDYDDDNAPIPNPLQQTYDKRFVQGQPKAGGGGRAGNGKAAPRKRGGGAGGGGGGGASQPDPLKTAVGYIGANAVHGGKRTGRGRRGR
jgi:23S rRNA pseudouridine2605 synthase